MAKINETPDFEAMWATTKKQLIDIVDTEGLNHFTESFDNQGFTDVVFEPWKPTHTDHQILRDNGDLWRSIQVFEKNEKRVVFGSDNEFAEIHNEGGTIPITKRARGYFWYIYKQTGDVKWKYMALHKGTHFVIHKRQFIGESQTLLNNIEKKFKRQLTKNFNNIKVTKL